MVQRGSYLRSAWNWLDIMVVVLSWIELLLPEFPFTFIRCFRALRPLRLVSKLPTLKITLLATLNSVPGSLRVLGVMFVFMMMFAVMGVQVFMGKFAECTDPCVLYGQPPEIHYRRRARWKAVEACKSRTHI